MWYMKPYPIELRERVLAAVDAGRATQVKIAETFKVSTLWIRKLIRQRRSEGTIAPRGHGGGRTAAFTGAVLKELDQFVSANQDATLEMIREHFAGRVDCSIVAIHNTLRRLGWVYKKSRYERVSKIGQM